MQGIFGATIPISCVIGDQQASLFGSGSFKTKDINCTMGTGSFLLVNTGSIPALAFEGAFPSVGWTISSQTTFVLELGVHDVGAVLCYAKSLGLLNHADESNDIAKSVSASEGVYFLPGAILIENCEARSSSFVGITEGTTSNHMVRAILESLAFQVCNMYDIMCAHYPMSAEPNIRIGGGVASNDFVIQTISDLTGVNIKRMQHVQSSSLGAAFLAGLYIGVWKNQDEISLMIGDFDTFSPISSKISETYTNWKTAVADSISHGNV